jgi:hypothetical protein
MLNMPGDWLLGGRGAFMWHLNTSFVPADKAVRMPTPALTCVASWQLVTVNALDAFKTAVTALLSHAAGIPATELSYDLIARCARMFLDSDTKLTVRQLMHACSVHTLRRNLERLSALNETLTADNFVTHFTEHPEYAAFFTSGLATGTCDKYLSSVPEMATAQRLFKMLSVRELLHSSNPNITAMFN